MQFESFEKFEFGSDVIVYIEKPDGMRPYVVTVIFKDSDRVYHFNMSVSLHEKITHTEVPTMKVLWRQFMRMLKSPNSTPEEIHDAEKVIEGLNEELQDWPQNVYEEVTGEENATGDADIILNGDDRLEQIRKPWKKVFNFDLREQERRENSPFPQQRSFTGFMTNFGNYNHHNNNGNFNPFGSLSF